ncbi:MAG: hypothetical protein AABY15_00475 [Nanoarchaeota archaeon]
MEKTFKKFGGDLITDLGEYVRKHLEKFPGETIYVGCDSDVRRNGRKVMYAEIVAFYDNVRHDGVHYVFNRELTEGFPVKISKTGIAAEDKKAHKKALTSAIFQRIWGEVERLEALGEYFEKELEGSYKRKTPEELVKLGYGPHQDKLVDLDVDINPIPGWSSYQLELIRAGKEPGIPKNRSFIVYDSAKTYLEGKGYRVRFKPHSWSSKCAADMICKGGRD